VLCLTVGFREGNWVTVAQLHQKPQDKTKESGSYEHLRHEWFTMYLSSEAHVVIAAGFFFIANDLTTNMRLFVKMD